MIAPPAGQPTMAMPAGSMAQPAQSLVAKLTPSRPATMANGPAREQFLLEITSPNNDLPGVASGSVRTPLNLCLVVDRSGSMEGQPLEYAKQACTYVVDMLSPNDILSIVTFEQFVELLMPPQRVTSKDPIKQGISRLTPGNTTNLYDALNMAMQQVISFQEGKRATRVIVLTDGDPTEGIKDFATLVAFAGELKAKGITTTFLGFGGDYNEELLAGMAKRAGGNHYFIPRPELLPEIFRTELEKLFTLTGQNLRLQMKLARWVKLRAATGHNVPPGDREFELTLTDLERGATLQQVFDFEFANHPLGHYRVATGRLLFDDSTTGQPSSMEIDFEMEFTADAARYSAPANPVVTQASDVAAASRAVERTIMGLKTGQITSMGAVAELQKTQALLLQDGRISEAQEVTMALRALQSGDHGTAEKTLMGTVVQLDQGKKQS